MSEPLKNPRHEKFTQLVASGVKPMKAYVSCGYAEGGAAQAAGNLLRRTDVASRLRYLQETAAAATAACIAFDKERVLARLDLIGRKAEEAGQFAAATRCEELIGKERGMFVERTDNRFRWDGDPRSLDAKQLATLMAALEATAFGQDTTARDQALEEIEAQVKQEMRIQ